MFLGCLLGLVSFEWRFYRVESRRSRSSSFQRVELEMCIRLFVMVFSLLLVFLPFLSAEIHTIRFDLLFYSSLLSSQLDDQSEMSSNMADHFISKSRNIRQKMSHIGHLGEEKMLLVGILPLSLCLHLLQMLQKSPSRMNVRRITVKGRLNS